MLIWDIIRDWFVMNVWGGILSNGSVVPGGMLGFFAYVEEDGLINETIGDFATDYFIKINGIDIYHSVVDTGYISISDWLSTTSTILVLIAVCFGLYFLVRYFFRMFAGLLSGR